MLNILKNIALEHIEPIVYRDIVVTTTTGEHFVKTKHQFVIPFINTDEGEIFLSEDGEFLISKEMEVFTNIEEIRLELGTLAPYLLDESIVEMTQYGLVRIDESKIVYNPKQAIDNFKEIINMSIEYKEREIKDLRKGYGFLRKLEEYC